MQSVDCYFDSGLIKTVPKLSSYSYIKRAKKMTARKTKNANNPKPK